MLQAAPGNMLLAWMGISPAAALNDLSAVTGALAVGLVYLLMLNWLDGATNVRRMAAAFSATLVAVNVTIWSQGLVAEVYALHLVLMLCILLMAQAIELRARRPVSMDKSSAVLPRAPWARLLIGLSFLIGLSLTHHAMTVLLIPALAAFLWIVDRRWWQQSLRVWIGVSASAVAASGALSLCPAAQRTRSVTLVSPAPGKHNSYAISGWLARFCQLYHRPVYLGWFQRCNHSLGQDPARPRGCGAITLVGPGYF